MKIFYIENARIPTEKAHGYQISKMCESFAALGHDVTLVCPTRKNSIREDVFSFYKLQKNFSVQKISSFDFVQFSFLGKIGFWLQTLWFTIQLFFFSLPKDAIVYTRNAEIAWVLSLRGYKVVFESHHWPQRGSWLHCFFVRKTSKIVCVTDALKKLYVEKNFAEKNILVERDAVDLAVFDIDVDKNTARTRLGLEVNRPIILYSGTLKTMEEDKGIKMFFDVIQTVSHKIPNILFLCVGARENEKKEYEALVKEKSLQENVRIIERVELSVLAEYQKAADILVMPFPATPHYSYYMSPLKMFEYMASKRPIIASDLPSVREVLSEKNAMLVSPDDKNGFAVAIEKLLMDPHFSDALSTSAYQAVEQYTWQKRAERISKFF